MRQRRLLLAGLALVVAQNAHAGDVFFNFKGGSLGTGLGRAVDGAGDVNGDGVDDLVIGARQPLGLGGSATVRSGKDGSLLRSWSGVDSFGQCVAGAGDVNADGFADVIVGEEGKVHVYSGKDGVELWLKSDFAGKLGASVDGAGDIDHDGHADFVAGAPLGVIAGKNAIGYVHVFSGATGVVLREWVGDILGDAFGASVSGGGDLNKDGYPDVVIGAPRYYFHAYLGRAMAYSGKDGFYLGQVQGTPDSDFGRAVSSSADLNRDGYADFVVGAPHTMVNDRNPVELGVVRAYSGKDFSLLREWIGPSAGSRFGQSVGMPGRINDDTYPDVVVGAPDATDLFTHGAAYALSGKDGSLLREWHGLPFTSGAFGTAVGGAGDLNDDGFADVVVGDPLDDTNAAAAGAVAVFSGLAYQPSWSNYGAGYPGTFGVPVFVADQNPRICGSIHLTLSNSRDALIPGALLVGFSQAAIDSHMGGLVLVGFPWFVFPITIPRIGLELPVDIICDSTLVGIEVYLQAIEADPGAALGASFSKGLELVLGL